MSAAASPTTSPTVVEVLVSSAAFSDAEQVEFTDEKAARAFARKVMRFAVSGSHNRRRTTTAPPAEPQAKE